MRPGSQCTRYADGHTAAAGPCCRRPTLWLWRTWEVGRASGAAMALQLSRCTRLRGAAVAAVAARRGLCCRCAATEGAAARCAQVCILPVAMTLDGGENARQVALRSSCLTSAVSCPVAAGRVTPVGVQRDGIAAQSARAQQCASPLIGMPHAAGPHAAGAVTWQSAECKALQGPKLVP